MEVSGRIDTKLAVDTLKAALLKRKTAPLMLHYDRGSQYTSKEFRRALDENHICASYSRTGYPYDNSVTESFFKYLKQDCINRKKFSTIDEVSLACFEYIQGYYNSYLPHQSNNQMTPNEKENKYFEEN